MAHQTGLLANSCDQCILTIDWSSVPFDVNDPFWEDKSISLPLAHLLSTIWYPNAIQPVLFPTHDHPYNDIIARFVAVRNSVSRTEAFLTYWHQHEVDASVLEHVAAALEHAMLQSDSCTSATIFGDLASKFKRHFNKAQLSEKQFEHAVVSRMLFPLRDLFHYTCDMSLHPSLGGTTTLRPDWLFGESCDRALEYPWLVVESKITKNQEDVVALQHLLHRMLVNPSWLLESQSATHHLMRPEFKLGLRFYNATRGTTIELSLLVLDYAITLLAPGTATADDVMAPGDPVTSSSANVPVAGSDNQLFYIRFRPLVMESKDFIATRRLIATLVLIGALSEHNHSKPASSEIGSSRHLVRVAAPSDRPATRLGAT